MAVNAESQFPVSKRPSWLMLCTGGLLTTGGLGWCLRLAYAEKPKLAIITYLAGSAGVCLTNMSFFYRPSKKSSLPNWIMLLTGGILSGTGFGYCLTIAMKEHPKSTTIAYIVGSLGYILANSAVYAAIMSGNAEKKPETRYSETGVYAKEISHIITCGDAKLYYRDGMYQCLNCKAHIEGKNSERENAEKKSEQILAKEKSIGFLQKSQLEMDLECERSIVPDKTRYRSGLYREARETCQDKNNGKVSYCRRDKKCKCRDETTQTESRFRMMGTQTQ